MPQRGGGENTAKLARALEAERSAERDIQQAEQEARDRVAAARARVRAIQRRAEQRIARVAASARTIAEARVQAEREREQSELEALRDVPRDDAALARAAGTLADELIGRTRPADRDDAAASGRADDEQDGAP